MDWCQCPRKLWLRTYRPELVEDSAETQARFQIGFEVGEIARAHYPGGRLIDPTDLSQALAETANALAERQDQALFEATFVEDGLLVRVDVLVPESNGYRLVEVKASTGVKHYHLSDAAIQCWVLGSQVPITGTAIAHVNNQFVYPGGGDYQGLLIETPVDEAIAELMTEVPDWILGARTTLADNSEPSITPGDQCVSPFDCPFQGHCTPDAPSAAYPIKSLPRLSGWRLAGLQDRGIEEITDIPDDYPLTATQRRVADAVQQSAPVFDPQVSAILEHLPWPRYYMDFETTTTAVPIWPGTRPYQQLPVQWSCHVQWQPGSTAPQQYLFEDQPEPLRAFAESLIQAVCEPWDRSGLRYPLTSNEIPALTAESFPETAATGPIFVYNAGFERRILRELAAALPDLGSALEGISARVIDLLPIVKRHYYHPDQQGSWSLKAVLPTMAPDLSYEGLSIGDGGKASDAWREILHPDTTPSRREELREALGEYCLQDTWAMIAIERHLGFASPDGQAR